MARFRNGHQKFGGRRKGTLNKRTRAQMEFYESLITDPAYVKHFKRRLKGGELDPELELRCHDGAWGKALDPNRQPRCHHVLPPTRGPHGDDDGVLRLRNEPGMGDD